MSFSLQAPSLTSVAVLLSTVAASNFLLGYWRYQRSPLKAIPTFPHCGYLASYYYGLRFMFSARSIVRQGYDSHCGRLFKIPRLTGWVVVATGPKLIDELRIAREEQLSSFEAVARILASDFTLDRTLWHDPYQINVVRGPLTRNIGAKLAEVRDEILASFGDVLPDTKDWVTLPAVETIEKIVCRASNRLFVGLPLCRNKDYLELTLRVTENVVIGAMVINVFPDFLKPLAAFIFTDTEKYIRRMDSFIRSMVGERRALREQYAGSEWPDKPNDMLMWLMDEAAGHPNRDNMRDLAIRMLLVNFAAIHTTSMGVTNVLYDLARRPELTGPLREEVQSVVAEHGWTKIALVKMKKLDSYLKEVTRYYPPAELIMNRVAKRDFVFSDGTVIPTGTELGVPLVETHFDGNWYEEASEFRAFRFSDLREKDGEGIKHQLTTVDPSFLVFGLGRHACPGRFFAAAELKLITANILLNYDIKLAEEGAIPSPLRFGDAILPNRTAKVSFKKLQ